jgi:hypothetical protein
MVVHNTIVGHYVSIWNSLALGRTEEGLFWEITHQGEMVRFEEFGQTIIDLVYQGADLTVEGVFSEWDSAAIESALWPYSATFGKQDCVGLLAVKGEFAKPLTLNASTCSSAYTDSYQSITFLKTILDPAVAARINLNNKPRHLPLRFRVFLTDNSADPGTSTPDNRFFVIA